VRGPSLRASTRCAYSTENENAKVGHLTTLISKGNPYGSVSLRLTSRLKQLARIAVGAAKTKSGWEKPRGFVHSAVQK